VRAFLASLRDRDIQVWADGDHLRCSAPTGKLSLDLQNELRQHKREILEFLRSAGSLARQQRVIVPMRPRGSRPAAFAFGGHNGDVFCFRAFARYLGEEQPFFGLQPPGLDGREEPMARVEDLASYFAAEIRSFQPNGPYVIAGFCAGGAIAFELARQLLQDGAEISSLVLFGAPYPTAYRRLPRLLKQLEAHLERVMRHARSLASLPLGERLNYIVEKLRRRRTEQAAERPATPDSVLVHRARVERAMFAALRRYVPGQFAGLMHLLLPCKEWAYSRDEPLRWRTVALQGQEYFGPAGCSTDTMLLEPHASTFAALFRQCQAVPHRDLATPVSARSNSRHANRRWPSALLLQKRDHRA
jgi:thioesterase domain-containing protein